MKSITYTLALFVFMAFISCKKDFLQRDPQTNVTLATFFKTTTDMETYTNGLYGQFNDYQGYDAFAYEDVFSDNTSTYLGGGELATMLNGNLTPANVAGGTWDQTAWGGLRAINYMFDNYGTVIGDSAAINHYLGIGHFFRARFYFGKVKRFSNVPWYSHALANNDSTLYKATDPRALVVDSIMNDLQYAVDNIKPIGAADGTRVSKQAALAFMARFCLYEGTYRKYHPEINLQSDYTRFLEKAVWAADQLMSGGNYTITGAGAEGYRALFSSATLNGNKEMIMWRAPNKELAVANNSGNVIFNYQWGLSKSLQETYLMKDGSRFTEQPGYATKTFVQIFSNRDPRLAETIAYPGFSTLNDPNRPETPLPTLGGYSQIKFYPRDPTLRGGFGLNYTSLPLYRYAEVLLNYAEAKAELGTATQADIDKSINLIRNRVAMPAMQMTAVNSDIDPILNAYYANVSGTNKGLILEIRRERRVELACEGLRFDDLQRWAAGARFADQQQGMYVPAFGAMDVTGDGKPDVAILPSPTDTASIKDLPDAVRKSIARFYLVNKDGTLTNIYLTNGVSGNIAFNADKSKQPFAAPKYYYRPIPLQQTVLNPNLKQPYGW